MSVSPKAKRAAVLGLIVVAVAVGVYVWRRERAREPPVVDLADADPEVARAVETARVAVLAAPRTGSAWGKLGMALAVHSFDREARACFAEAERLDPADARWPYLHGMILRAYGPAEAVPMLERAVQRASGLNPEARQLPRLLLAETMLEQNRLDEAEELFRQVAENDPQRARACLGLGRLALARDDPRAAVAWLREAADGAPEAKPIHAQLAEALLRKGEETAAREVLRQAQRLADDFSWPDPIVEEMWQLRAGVKAQLDYADQLLRQGRGTEGVDVLRQTTRDHPSSYEAWLALGRTLIQLRQPQLAEEALRTAVELRDTEFEAHFFLAAALHQRADYRAAVGEYQQALRNKPHHALAHYNLGMCFKELNDSARAIEAFREAVRYKPDLANGHRELGALLLRAGRTNEARLHLESAVQLAPEDESAKKLLNDAGPKQ
jgi:tetratricopeptide (TPR) repeat protein